MKIKDIKVNQYYYKVDFLHDVPRVVKGLVSSVQTESDIVKFESEGDYEYEISKNITSDKRTAEKWQMLAGYNLMRYFNNEIAKLERRKAKLSKFLERYKK
jgi:ubiquinone biosynthesis protein UbiJ